MAVVPWSTLALTLWPLTAATSVDPGGGFYGRISQNAASYLVGAAGDTATADRIVTQQIQRMANFYRQKLILRFSQVYPDTLPEMERQYERRKQAVTEFRNYKESVEGYGEVLPATTLSFGDFWPTGSVSSGIFGYSTGLKPALYFFDSSVSAIDINLLANTTNPGDYAGDTNIAAAIGLYCNHGTKATPVWVNANRNTLPDFISNPEEIVECGYLRAISYVKSFGTDMDMEDFQYRQEKMPSAFKMKREEATEAENVAFALLQIDRSGNGVISDYDRKATQVKKWFF